MVHADERFNGYLDYGNIRNFNDFVSNLEKYATDYRYNFNKNNCTCHSDSFTDGIKIFEFKK